MINQKTYQECEKYKVGDLYLSKFRSSEYPMRVLDLRKNG